MTELNTIKRDEIKPGDIVKVLVALDDVEEHSYATVSMNTGNVLGVNYLTPTPRLYKSATLYTVDDEVSPAPYESLTEHYESGTTFNDLEFKRVDSSQWARLSEIDVEDSCSSIWSEGSDSESDLSFVVSDGEPGQGIDVPPDHREVDAAWNAWEPLSPGARSFKETIDNIEANIRARQSI